MGVGLRHLQMLDSYALQVRNACLQRIRDSRDKLIWDKRAGKAQQQVCHAPVSVLMWRQTDSCACALPEHYFIC